MAQYVTLVKEPKLDISDYSGGDMKRIDLEKVHIRFDFTYEQISDFMGQLELKRHQFTCDNGTPPTALFLGYHDYKKLTYAMSNCDVERSLYMPSWCRDCKISIVPNTFEYTQFGFAEAHEQFKHESFMRERKE